MSASRVDPLASATRRRRRWAGLGLRARLTLTFGLGALALSASMAGLTYFTARQFSLNQRQSTDIRLAYANANLVLSDLRAHDTQYVSLLDTLDSSGSPSSLSLLVHDGQIFSAKLGLEKTIPASMLSLVQSTPTVATQRVDPSGGPTSGPQLIVGISLPSVHAAYFEVFSLEDLSTELRLLGLVLGFVALVTTIAGAAIGGLAARRVLMPLATVSHVAETIAGGQLDTRLDAGGDADLATLAGSFNRMADALQERIRHEARFTSDVSHELRSPLTTLSAALGVLDSHRKDLAPRASRALDLLEIEVRRFQRMVDDLLEMSRIDAGSAELLLDEVEVGELLRHAAASTGAGGIPIDMAPGLSDVRLMVDKRRIERVVANLVDNAAQYAGGATRLAVERANSYSTEAVRIVVADHGPGVAPSERERIFERFYRGQSAGQRGATNGTGLGLALVTEHVRLHGGRVWVEDGTGAENRFIVELPVYDTNGEPSHEETDEPRDPDGGENATARLNGPPPGRPSTVSGGQASR
jgi:two-component system, OmpR family, sensor histidine kinase MtrB